MWVVFQVIGYQVEIDVGFFDVVGGDFVFEFFLFVDQQFGEFVVGGWYFGFGYQVFVVDDGSGFEGGVVGGVFLVGLGWYGGGFW